MAAPSMPESSSDQKGFLDVVKGPDFIRLDRRLRRPVSRHQNDHGVGVDPTQMLKASMPLIPPIRLSSRMTWGCASPPSSIPPHHWPPQYFLIDAWKGLQLEANTESLSSSMTKDARGVIGGTHGGRQFGMGNRKWSGLSRVDYDCEKTARQVRRRAHACDHTRSMSRPHQRLGHGIERVCRLAVIAFPSLPTRSTTPTGSVTYSTLLKGCGAKQSLFSRQAAVWFNESKITGAPVF